MAYNISKNRIRSKWGCYWNTTWCNRHIEPQIESTGGWYPEAVTTFGLTSKNVGYIWWITKVRVKTADHDKINTVNSSLINDRLY